VIHYSGIRTGDILRIVGAGAPGYAKNGELVRVIETHHNSVAVENKDGRKADFVYNCGAERLEKTNETELG
jgi:hypothetical protein